MKRVSACLAAFLAAGLVAVVHPQAASAQTGEMEATVNFTDTAVIVETRGPYSNMTLSISGPNKFYAEVFSGSKAPAIDLRKVDEYDDGVYHYHVSAATEEIVPVRTALDDGRESITKQLRRGVATDGAFLVKGGVIVKHEDIPEDK